MAVSIDLGMDEICLEISLGFKSRTGRFPLLWWPGVKEAPERPKQTKTGRSAGYRSAVVDDWIGASQRLR